MSVRRKFKRLNKKRKEKNEHLAGQGSFFRHTSTSRSDSFVVVLFFKIDEELQVFASRAGI